MGLLHQVALVSEASNPPVSSEELTEVSAAIQKQVARDLAQHWAVEATVDPFSDLAHVPPGYWPVVIRDDIGRDEAGIHCDENQQPFALVTSGPGWSVVASHEILEMLVDPFGNRLVAGDSMEPGQGRVEYLVEVADPVGATRYTCNGIPVADFITPQYFDPVGGGAGVYSFTQAVTTPRDVLRGGYLTWHDPIADEWWQRHWFDTNQPSPVNRKLGALPRGDCTLRAMIDNQTRKLWRADEPCPMFKNVEGDRTQARRHEAVAESSRQKAKRLRVHIDRLCSKRPSP